MTTSTNWPNPERLGYPMFPEYCGEHILKEMLTGKEIPVFWDAYCPRSPGWNVVALNNQTPEAVSKYFSYVRCEHVRITTNQLTELLAGKYSIPVIQTALRVWAEIGRDSERLDWFEENCSGAKSQWNEKQSLVEWQIKDGEWFPNLRTAIDKARGEDNA